MKKFAILSAVLMTGLFGATAAHASTAPPIKPASTTSPPTSASAQTTTTPGTGAVRVVTLVTGDKVAISTAPGGKPQVNVEPAQPGSAFQVMTLGSQVYVIPQDAARYLGNPLDMSLFDVTRLASRGYANSDRPLRLSFSGSVPAGARANGSIDRAGESRFGAALAAAARTRQRAFPGTTRITLAGSPRAGGILKSGAPGQLYTLTIEGYDRLGHPDTGSAADVMNVDNVNNFLASQTFYRGVLKYSVPAGHYEIAAFIQTDFGKNNRDFTLVTDPQVTVTKDTTVVLRAHGASRVWAATPNPASTVDAQLSLQRNPATGPSFTTTFETFGNFAIYATSTRPVTEGQLYFYPYLRLGDATGGMSKYLYDLEFPYVGSIPGNLTVKLSRSQLTAVDARYHSPYPGRVELEARSGAMPWQASMVFGSSQFAAPLERTEYVLPRPGMLWYHDVAADAQDSFGFTQDNVRTYGAGWHVTDDWMSQPMPPGVQESSIGVQPCPVCRTGNTLSLLMMPFVDNAQHIQLPDPSVTIAMSLYRNGALVGQQPTSFGQFPMSAGQATYKLVLDQVRTAPWWPTTTKTSTTWTWPSWARSPDTLPRNWVCPNGKSSGRSGTAGGTKGCSIEPLMFVNYTTNAGIDDVVPAGGKATVDVSVGHQMGVRPAAVSGFTAQVSFNDGRTWTTVPATRTSDGHYRLVYEQPGLKQTTGFAALRISAKDTRGDTIQQTITRAYPLAVLKPPSGSGGQPGEVRACGGPVAAPYVQCMAIVNTAARAAVPGSTPTGYGPADLKSAYKLPNTGRGQTVALIDAYDDPHAQADLAKYRTEYGLPPCTWANGCFRKLNQKGEKSPLPSPDSGWSVEMSLDLDMVSATCPRCHILLVEANSSSIADLGPAVDTAVRLGATEVSNSYGTVGEFSGEQTFEQYYNHPHVPVVVSSGDYGYGNGALLINSIEYPSASRYVIAAGGTSLTRDSSTTREWKETAWSWATSGCSAYIAKPAWQKDRLCSLRTVADVSAVADPKTGVAVYDSYGPQGTGWMEVGGTSAAAPIIASVYALAGNGATQHYASGLYANPGHLFDVTSGSNGDNCSDTYLCNAEPGYDGPTGLGTPDGTGSF